MGTISGAADSLNPKFSGGNPPALSHSMRTWLR
jgi:hypothetical protein